MPVFNAALFLRRAVDSVLKQTYQNWELICVDDGSTDNSIQILESYGHQISILKCEHRGAPAARNAALAVATGTYIAFLDADDQFTENALKSQVEKYLGQNEEQKRAIVLGRSSVIFETPESRGNYFLDPGKVDDNHLAVLGAALIPTSIFSETGNFDEILLTVDDTDWFMRIHELGVKIILNNTLTLLIRRHNANLTSQSAETARAHLALFRARILKKRNG
jgi:glycosyltransferase involved in cell wall biosynthesis